MPIVSTGKTLSTTEYYEKKRKAAKKRRIIVGGILFVLLVASVFLSRLESLRIKDVVVNGTQAIDAAKVEAKVAEELEGSFFWIIPRDNALLYGENRIRARLKEQFPRFSSITLSLEGLKTLQVSVVERQPHALYCEGAELCWFLDSEGFVFDAAPTFSEGVYFTYTEKPALESPLGHSLLPREEFQALDRFVGSLPMLGLTPLALEIASADMTLELTGGARILWGRESDLERTFGNLESFLKSPTIQAQADFLSKIGVLDLRTEDRVFYRFEE